MKTDTQLMDCTARDGGYVLGWKQDPQYIRHLIKMASECEIEFVEVGLINRRTDKSGWWDAINEGIFKSIQHNIHTPKIAVMFDYPSDGQWPTGDLRWLRTNIAVVRIACRYQDVESAMKIAPTFVGEYGVDVCINVMQLSTLNDHQLHKIGELAHKYRPWALYFADSMGATFPQRVGNVYGAMKTYVGDEVRLGFHGHNNLQLAFANSIAAIECGATLIDCTVDGVGRGGGNLCTELAVGLWRDPYKVRSVVEFYKTHLMNRTEVWGWGHQELATALTNSHPNYATLDSNMSYEALLYNLETLSETDRRVFNRHAFEKYGDD